MRLGTAPIWLLLLSGLGCAGAPQVPRVAGWNENSSGSIAVEEDERALWNEAKEHFAELEEKELFVEDEALSTYLDGLLDSLLPNALPADAPEPVVRVLRSPLRNAGAAPDGTLLVHSALLAAIENEAQLAALLGHELAHFLGRHLLIEKRFALLSASTVERMELSRAQEEEADRVGLELMMALGYDPRDALRLLSLIAADDTASRGPVPSWESHPFISDRIEELGRRMPRSIPQTARREPQRYEEAVANLLLVAAETELEAGLLARASAATARHLRLRPNSGRAYYLKAEHTRLTEREGRRAPKVRDDYERAVALAPDDPDAVRALALLYRETGDHARARQLLSHYLEVAPDAADRKLMERYLGGPCAARHAALSCKE